MQNAIETSIVIEAPAERVWASLVDSGEFGRWFRAEVEGPFVAGRLCWMISTVEPENRLRFWIRPVLFDPPRVFAFDWPAGDAPGPDPEKDATTRVTFTLAPQGARTRVTVTEQGFAALPPDIAARKYPDNTQGWDLQMQNLKSHVEA